MGPTSPPVACPHGEGAKLKGKMLVFETFPMCKVSACLCCGDPSVNPKYI